MGGENLGEAAVAGDVGDGVRGAAFGVGDAFGEDVGFGVVEPGGVGEDFFGEVRVVKVVHLAGEGVVDGEEQRHVGGEDGVSEAGAAEGDGAEDVEGEEGITPREVADGDGQSAVPVGRG